MLKQNKGITLVALVITIIVLLILAGVSISLVVGDNGVLTQAKGSSDASKVGQMKEALGLAIEDCQTQYFNKYTTDATAKVEDYITAQAIDAALEGQGYGLYNASKKAINKDDNTIVKLTDTAATYYVGPGGKNSAEDALAPDYIKVELVLTSVGAKAEFTDTLNPES